MISAHAAMPVPRASTRPGCRWPSLARWYWLASRHQLSAHCCAGSGMRRWPATRGFMPAKASRVSRVTYLDSWHECSDCAHSIVHNWANLLKTESLASAFPDALVNHVTSKYSLDLSSRLRRRTSRLALACQTMSVRRHGRDAALHQLASRCRSKQVVPHPSRLPRDVTD